MTNDEFDAALTDLGLTSVEAAAEMRQLSGSKTSSSYINAMRSGTKPVTQAAAIYARLRLRAHNAPDSRRDTAAALRRLADALDGR